MVCVQLGPILILLDLLKGINLCIDFGFRSDYEVTGWIIGLLSFIPWKFDCGVADQEDNVDERDIVYEREVAVEEDEVKNENVIASREIGSEEDDSTREGVITLTFKDISEVAALQSALSQLLQQVC